MSEEKKSKNEDQLDSQTKDHKEPKTKDQLDTPNTKTTKVKEPKKDFFGNSLKVNLKPNLGGFLAAYIVFSLPGMLIGFVWFIISVIILFSIIIGSFAGSQETSLLDLKQLNNSSDSQGILIYRLNGPITSAQGAVSDRQTSINLNVVRDDFEAIKEDNNIKNVVFAMDTPGGEVFASEVLGDLIIDLTKHKGQVESVFYYDSVSASGGLLASYKNEDNYIVASPYGQTGSIGVMTTLPNFSGTAEKIGYSETIIKSSQSKDIGNIFRDPTQNEINYLQGLIDDEFNNFKNIVKRGRKLTDAEVNEVATGLVFDNKEAEELGLVDRLGDQNLAVERAAKNAGLGDDYKVWELNNQMGFFDIFSAEGFQSMIEVKFGPEKVIDRTNFFQAGRMYMIDETRI